MFYFLSKTISALVMPLTWIFLLLVWSIFGKNQKIIKRRIFFTMVVLYLVCCPALVNRLIWLWEIPNRKISELSEQYDVCVVLTGMLYMGVPDDRPYFQAAADRIIAPLYLLKANKIKHILISGGFPPSPTQTEPEAVQLKKLLLTMGIADSLITVEPHSLNTHENAKFTAQLLRQSFPEAKKILLVSSAFHLRRAQACFRAQGIEVTPFATDFKSVRAQVYPWMSLFPSESAFEDFYVLVHEIVGYLTYRALGYAR